MNDLKGVVSVADGPRGQEHPFDRLLTARCVQLARVDGPDLQRKPRPSSLVAQLEGDRAGADLHHRGALPAVVPLRHVEQEVGDRIFSFDGFPEEPPPSAGSTHQPAIPRRPDGQPVVLLGAVREDGPRIATAVQLEPRPCQDLRR